MLWKMMSMWLKADMAECDFILRAATVEMWLEWKVKQVEYRTYFNSLVLFQAFPKNKRLMRSPLKCLHANLFFILVGIRFLSLE